MCASTASTAASAVHSEGVTTQSVTFMFTTNSPDEGMLATSAATAFNVSNTQSRRAASSRALSLSAIAKVVTRFLFGEAQLPTSLLHYSAFFAGFATGLLAAPALYAFLVHNHCDRAKVQLAVFHIMRLFQHHPDYPTLLRDPPKLLMQMEPKVMHLLHKHLTKNEAAEVMKELKRNYLHTVVTDHINKRVRRNKRDILKEPEPHLMPAYTSSPRGFLPVSVGKLPREYYEHTPGSEPASIHDSPFPHVAQDVPRSDSVLADEDQMEIDQADAPLPIPLPPIPKYYFASPCPPAQRSAQHFVRRSAAPSPESEIFVGRVTTSTPALPEEDDGYQSDVSLDVVAEAAEVSTSTAEGPHKEAKDERKQPITGAKSSHAPHHGSFGLDYDDKSIYSSDSSSDDEDRQPPSQPAHDNSNPSWLHKVIAKAEGDPKKGRQMDTPPAVVRRLHGVKCSGTSLSPIQGSPSATEDLPAVGDVLPATEQVMVEPAPGLPFEHWSTQAQLEYSSSSSELEEENLAAPVATSPAPANSPIVATQDVANIPVVPVEIPMPKEVEDLQDENRAPSPSRSSARSPTHSPPRRSSPLADVTATTQRKSPTSPSTSPSQTPLKRGRIRGRAAGGIAQDVPATIKTAKKTKKSKEEGSKTPGTRKSSRGTAYQGSYGK